MMIDGEHLGRLMRMCRTLAAGGGTRLAQLQSRLRMSRRTIFRDLNTLQEMGIKVDLGEKGYRIKLNPAACRRLLMEHQLRAVKKLLDACLK